MSRLTRHSRDSRRRGVSWKLYHRISVCFRSLVPDGCSMPFKAEPNQDDWSKQISIITQLPEHYRDLENIPGWPSAKVAPVECHLATMALFKIKTITIPEGGLHGTSCHPIWGVSASGLSCTPQGWQTFCHLGSKSAGTLSCNPALHFGLRGCHFESLFGQSPTSPTLSVVSGWWPLYSALWVKPKTQGPISHRFVHVKDPVAAGKKNLGKIL